MFEGVLDPIGQTAALARVARQKQLSKSLLAMPTLGTMADSMGRVAPGLELASCL